MQEFIVQQIQDSLQTKQRLLEAKDLLDALETTARQCMACYRQGGKILLAGNGGSAADAQHIAAELVGRYAFERPALNALALTTDTSALTAIGNDYGYEKIFSRQIEGVGNHGDLFIGISTSGNSQNVLNALHTARTQGITTVALVGRDGGAMASMADIALIVPSRETPRIQEAHILMGHILCDMIERELFGNGV